MFIHKHKLTLGLTLLVVLIAAIIVMWPKIAARSEVENLYPMSSFSHVHGMSVDVKDVTRLYLATHQGLYRLDNDSNLYRIGKTRNDLMGFSPHPQEVEIFFSSGHPQNGGNIGVQKSTDGGVSWTKLSNGLNGPVDFHAMAISTADPETLYGWNGSLQRSGDGGKTWEKLSAKGLSNVISLTTHPRQPATIIAATAQGIMISEDRGQSWEILSGSLEGAFVLTVAIDYQYSNQWLSYSDKLGLASSNDSGKTWQKIESDFSGERVMHLAFASSDSSLVYAVTDKNNIYKSTDGGIIWKKVF